MCQNYDTRNVIVFINKQLEKTQNFLCSIATVYATKLIEENYKPFQLISCYNLNALLFSKTSKKPLSSLKKPSQKKLSHDFVVKEPSLLKYYFGPCQAYTVKDFSQCREGYQNTGVCKVVHSAGSLDGGSCFQLVLGNVTPNNLVSYAFLCAIGAVSCLSDGIF